MIFLSAVHSATTFEFLLVVKLSFHVLLNICFVDKLALDISR